MRPAAFKDAVLRRMYAARADEDDASASDESSSGSEVPSDIEVEDQADEDVDVDVTDYFAAPEVKEKLQEEALNDLEEEKLKQKLGLKRYMRRKEREAKAKLEQETPGEQLSKNKRRKLKKKRRVLQLKAEGKPVPKRHKAKEFTYDPSAADETPPVSPTPTTEAAITPSGDPTPIIATEEAPLTVGKYSRLIADLKRQAASEHNSPEEELQQFFALLLDHFKLDLDFSSRDAFRIWTETESGCKELFAALSQSKIPREALRGLLVVKRTLLAQKFLAANESYLSLSIGDALWPESSRKMDIEQRRRLLSAVKRLMTFFEQEVSPKFITVDRQWFDERGIRPVV